MNISWGVKAVGVWNTLGLLYPLQAATGKILFRSSTPGKEIYIVHISSGVHPISRAKNTGWVGGKVVEG